jgi:hypothetical protein
MLRRGRAQNDKQKRLITMENRRPRLLLTKAYHAMDRLTSGEETMIAALAREVRKGDWAACGTLSPMPAAALWLARLTHAPQAQRYPHFAARLQTN